MSTVLSEKPTDVASLLPDLSVAAESLAEGLLIADNTGLIIYVNSRFAEITGYSRDEILGNRVYDVFFPAGSAESIELAVQMQERYRARNAGQSETYELNIIRKDGTRRSIDIKAAPLFDQNRAIIGSIGAVSDVTEKKQLEEQVRWSQKMDAVGRLAGGVAHDFNNLLTVILGYADLLRQQLEADDPRIRKVDVIREASEAASALTQQLLTLSRRQVVQMRAIDVNEVVESSLRVMQGIVGERINMLVDLAPRLPFVRGDGSLIQQMLLNFVVNARDAMPEGGNLLIETALVDVSGNVIEKTPASFENTFLRLRVDDNGEGMDAATKARIFEPFFTTKKKGLGSGLGLSICLGIAQEHDAEIRVSSEPGQGATFDLLFPPTALAPASMQTPTSWKTIAGTETILVVEDHIAVRVLVRESLERYGYKVIEADDGSDALKLLESMPGLEIDLLVTDFIMPKLNGLELAQKVQAKMPAVKVVVISGYADDPSAGQKSQELGYIFLSKPFSPEQLVRTVRTSLNSNGKARLAAV